MIRCLLVALSTTCGALAASGFAVEGRLESNCYFRAGALPLPGDRIRFRVEAIPFDLVGFVDHRMFDPFVTNDVTIVLRDVDRNR